MNPQDAWSPRHDGDFLISKSAASLGGHAWFFTGVACKYGHVSKRNVCNGECRDCVHRKNRMKRIADPERMRAKDRRKYYLNLEHSRARTRTKYARHAERRRNEAQRKYREELDHKAKIKLKAITWRKANPGKVREIVNRRHERVKRATPPWLTIKQQNQIRDIYIAAGKLGRDWHVDHIYPLRAKNSCGLHVPWNLQIMPASQNHRKRNRTPEELL